MTQPALQQQIAAAVQHHHNGRFAQAEAEYRALLAQYPQHPELLHLLGALFGQTGRPEPAIDHISRAIAIYPGNFIYHSNLSEIYRRVGRTEEAIDSARRAIQLKPDFARSYGNLGAALHAAGQLDDAIAAFRRAIELDPKLADVINNLALAFKAKDQCADAAQAYRNVCNLQPQSHEAWCNLAVALRENKQFDEAVAAFNKSISLKPDFAPAYNNLGVAYSENGRLDEAIELFRKATEIQPDYAHAFKNLGVAYGEQMKYPESLAAFQKAIEIDPNLAEIRSNRAIILLTLGDYDQGWKDYEWRWRARIKELAPPRQITQPLWDGSPLNGRTILLHAEQGFGDAIQFARYIPMVVQRGGRILLEVPRELAGLMRNTPGIAQVIPRGDALPSFDLHCPLMSLARVFGTTLESIPSQFPYLFPSAASVANWKNKIAADQAKLKVGVVWAGSPKHNQDRQRSMTTELLAPLAEIKDATFYSLQKGGPSRQPPPPGVNWIDLTSSLHDFSDTAALITNLDLVIAVDTAVAHLSGALAKPTWILVPFNPDWRWLLHRTDSPWYPTVRLFRQKSRNDWPSVVRLVVEDLLRMPR